ncbi:MAG: hypothetical protein NT099_08600 [Candidatus Saganbacteria bacterium]|nr:hypothetical protein [Candidatus Saganbacteria bacterium]
MKKIVFCGLVGLLMVGLIFTPAYARALFLQTQQGDTNVQQVNVPVAADENFAMRSFQLKYANAKSASSALNELLAEGEKVSVDENLNTILARASERNLDRIAVVIAKMDGSPLQVMVEAKILEVKGGNGDTNNPSYLGVSFKDQKDANNFIQFNSTDTLSLAATAIGLYGQVLSGDLTAYLQALERKLGYDLVASPWVTALNHQPAEILIGSKYGYQTAVISQTQTVQQVNYLEVGTKLKFTPHINEDGFIIMDIYPSVSEGSVINNLPQENTTETKNKVLIKDGQSVVIGGLTKDYSNLVEIGVPYLSAIPFLGTLFKRTEVHTEKRNLMVIITPHIVTPELLTTMANKANDLDKARQQKFDDAKLIH